MLHSSFNFRPVVRRLSAALCVAGLCGSTLAAAPLCQAPDNLIRNPGIESGTRGQDASPNDWRFESPVGTALGSWDAVDSHSGRHSLRIDTHWYQADDARWLQTVDVPLKTPLYLSGQIKSENVSNWSHSGGPGATVSVLGRWDQPVATLGTTDWHRTGMSLVTDTSPLQVSARLGFWSGVATGTAWYDDVSLVPLQPQLPHPSWKVLVLVYDETDTLITDTSGVQHHVRSDATPAELELVAEQAREFVLRDIPALSSGNMLPTLTVQHASHPLNHLTVLAPTTDWWPAWNDTADEVQGSYDSVIVIWDSRVRDITSGATFKLGGPAVLNRVATVAPIYSTFDLTSAGLDGSRNQFKQNWGSAAQIHYQALQVQPLPAIDVNVNAALTQYVNCKTGRRYLQQTEPTGQRIVNSIWNNDAGFFHDLYSGLVAQVQAPHTCLGLGPQVWAWGGPETHSGSKPVFTARQRLAEMLHQLVGLQTARMLGSLPAETLVSDLEEARWEMSARQPQQVRTYLQNFNSWVDHLIQDNRLENQAGQLLISASKTVDGCLD